jgi:phosphoserine phosphatase
LVTFTGEDRPGVAAGLFAAVADRHVVVLDVEQVVVRGHLTLAVLLTQGDDAPALEADLRRAGKALDMK